MADIGLPTFLPAPPSILQTVAETQRIARGILTSNPLTNAITNAGLMQWVGRYGGMFLWIGEFNPADPNQLDAAGHALPQRAFSLVRDDPKHMSTFAMYDWDPYLGGPLRQKFGFQDADGRTMWREGESGGWGWPRLPIVMGQVNAINTNTVAGTTLFGRSQVVGRHIDFMFQVGGYPLWPVQAQAGFANVSLPLFTAGPNAGFQITWNISVTIGANTVTSANSTATAGAFINTTLDLGASWMPNLASDFMNVNLNAWMTGGSSNCFQLWPVYFHNVTLWTNRQLEGF